LTRSEGGAATCRPRPRKTDGNTYENVWKKDGKVTVSAKVAASADGKTLTVTQTGKVSAVAVYDKHWTLSGAAFRPGGWSRKARSEPEKDQGTGTRRDDDRRTDSDGSVRKAKIRARRRIFA
jgi:hypothetical protein